MAAVVLHVAPGAKLMFRFDQLIRSSTTVRDIKLNFPETISVLESYGFRDVCDDCPIEIVARRQGLSPMDVVNELNRVLFSKRTLDSKE